MDLSEVSNILFRERQVRDLLVFKLEEEHRVKASGDQRWLAHASHEVQTVRAAVKRIEFERAVVVTAAARDLGGNDGQSLADLAELAPAPWRTIFSDHGRALDELAVEAASVQSRNSADPVTIKKNLEVKPHQGKPHQAE